MKKIYSLNLVSFLRVNGLKEIHIDKDVTNNKIFYVFPQTKEVMDLIKAYKNPAVTVALHEFTTNFKTIKKEINKFIEK